jgi:hypothetical protein
MELMRRGTFMNTLIRRIVIAFIVLTICGCGRGVDSRQGNSPEKSQADQTDKADAVKETADEVAWRRGSEQIQKLGGHLCPLTPWKLGQAYVWSFGKTFSDDGLEQLARLPEIGKLYLDNTQVTDAGLSHLVSMPQLHSLSLKNTRITDAGLSPLETLPQLRYLSLENTQITDAGLQHLEALNRLDRLDLRKTQVTDSGFEHLKKLTQLRSLNIRQTRVTADGIESLQQALPNCEIFSSIQPQYYPGMNENH